MNAWTLAAIALVPPFAATILSACRGGTGARLAAMQAATALATVLLFVVSFATDQPSSVDLGLTVSLLGLPGTLAFALFAERWL